MTGPRASQQPDRTLPVTVVIPAWNREREVAEAIASVRIQQRPPSEILVVDDGSTDGTAAAAERAGARVIRQENQGVSAARNTGIRAAAQPWIALLDSDDLWEPERLALQWKAHERAPDVELFFSDHAVFDDTGITMPSALAERPPFERVARREIAPGVYRCEAASLARAMFGGNLLKPSTLLVRRQLMLDVGLFDPSFGHAEDREMGLRLLAHTDAVLVARPLVRYRAHEEGASTDDLRMTLGAVTVADRVLAAPYRYPPGAAEHFRESRPERLRAAAILLMERDRFPEARRMLVRSFRDCPSLRTSGVFVASILGARFYDLLRRVKRRFGLPGIRGG